jgi:hypothetical protein
MEANERPWSGSESVVGNEYERSDSSTRGESIALAANGTP